MVSDSSNTSLVSVAMRSLLFTPSIFLRSQDLSNRQLSNQECVGDEEVHDQYASGCRDEPSKFVQRN
jgi:hypothetical protein